MKTFLVGGAVRDTLMGVTPKDRDYVVVGSDRMAMLAAGFVRVGADFPVFLHPETKEEYALARTERKSGVGYTGFVCDFNPSVTLEEDLSRRDLTINAMAMDADGGLIDPYGGETDLRNKVLRHVSEAFADDPLRVLRVARFAARYAHLGFGVAPETMDLMSRIVERGELSTLTKERVRSELFSALGTENPAAFITVLRECGALRAVLPEVDRLFGVPQPAEHHPEIDTGVHVLMVLQQAVKLTNESGLAPQQKLAVRFAALLHDLGKGVTTPDLWPRHVDHEEAGVPLVEGLCARLGVAREAHDLAILASREHLRCHRLLEMRPGKVLSLLKSLDAFRRPERALMFALACEADARGRLGLEDREYPQSGFLLRAFAAAQTVRAADFAEKELVGAALGEAIDQGRCRAIACVAR